MKAIHDIAPYCYDHIRLHRGILRNSDNECFLLLRTLFLGYNSSNRSNSQRHSIYWKEEVKEPLIVLPGSGHQNLATIKDKLCYDKSSYVTIQ